MVRAETKVAASQTAVAQMSPRFLLWPPRRILAIKCLTRNELPSLDSCPDGAAKHSAMTCADWNRALGGSTVSFYRDVPGVAGLFVLQPTSARKHNTNYSDRLGPKCSFDPIDEGSSES